MKYDYVLVYERYQAADRSDDDSIDGWIADAAFFVEKDLVIQKDALRTMKRLNGDYRNCYIFKLEN